MRVGLSALAAALAACLAVACGCTGPSGTELGAQDVKVSLELAQVDKDGLPHAFRATFENTSGHDGILSLHGALPGGRGRIIPSSLWLGIKAEPGVDAALAHTYGATPEGERVRLGAGEKLVREYPAADFCLWGPMADVGPNPDYPFARCFRAGQTEVQVQVVYVADSPEDEAEEPGRALSDPVTMRCSYDERIVSPEKDPLAPVGTPLHQAARSGDVAAVQRLLAQGADVNAQDETGRTSLREAAAKGQARVAEILLAKGADSSVRDHDGNTPLKIAAEQGHVEAMKLLLAHGAEVDAKNSVTGVTALGGAALEGQLEAARLLLERGADPNAESAYEDTPLCYAALRGHEDVVALLLDKGADISASGRGGRTALHYAADEGRPGVVKLLLDRGADPNVKDRRGYTVLAWTEQGDPKAEVVRLLEEHGAKE